MIADDNKKSDEEEGGSKAEERDKATLVRQDSKPSEPNSYGLYKFISDLFESFGRIIVGIAWPITLFFILSSLISHADGVRLALHEIAGEFQSFKMAAGPSNGIVIEAVSRAVESGLARQIPHPSLLPRV